MSTPLVPRLLGVDYGLKRVGLALSDPLGVTAQPLETLERRGDKHICREIAAIVADREVSEVVVGLPLDMDGTRGEAARGVQSFVDRLGNYTRVPILLWDERLTSAAAERSLTALGVGRKKRRQVVDQLAACLILQGVLDQRAHDRSVHE